MSCNLSLVHYAQPPSLSMISKCLWSLVNIIEDASELFLSYEKISNWLIVLVTSDLNQKKFLGLPYKL